MKFARMQDVLLLSFSGRGGVLSMNSKSLRFLGLIVSTLFFASLCSGVCPGSLHRTSLAGYALSPDATRIAALANDGTLFWWDVASSKRTQLLECVKPDIFDTPILFSPDSARVAVVEDNRIHILEIPSGHSIAVLTAPGVRNLEAGLKK
jgi:WD40 repeat protein